MHVNTLEGRVGSGSSSSAFATQLISPSPGAALFHKSFNDPKIAEYDALVQTSFGRVLAAAEKIGDQVLLATKGDLASEKDILLKIDKYKQPNIEGFVQIDSAAKQFSPVKAGNRSTLMLLRLLINSSFSAKYGFLMQMGDTTCRGVVVDCDTQVCSFLWPGVDNRPVLE
eukprot:Gb_20560 [translate_table: standard]